MPVVGQIETRTKEKRKHIWVRCPICQEERWQQLRSYKIQATPGRCPFCNMAEYGRRGRKKDRYDYLLVKLKPESPFYPMAQRNRYVREHRLVMAQHLGRCLERWEVVHHKGIRFAHGSRENKQDNKIDNLELLNYEKHNQITILENRIKYLEGLLEFNKIDF